jgi:hypothetical protein
MQASNGLMKKIPKNAPETTNNLVVQGLNFPYRLKTAPAEAHDIVVVFWLAKASIFMALTGSFWNQKIR